MVHTLEDLGAIVLAARDELCEKFPDDGQVVVVAVKTTAGISVHVGIDSVAREGGPPIEELSKLVEAALLDYTERCPNLRTMEMKVDWTVNFGGGGGDGK
jgi:hypothetical protein